MTFPDPPPPIMHPPFSGGSDMPGFWPQFPVANEYHEQHSQFEKPPLKRPRNFEENQSNSAPYPPPPMNPMTHPPNAPINRGINNIFFKTRMCTKFKSGLCRNGEFCNFAHGQGDVRKPPPNWQDIVNNGREEERSNGNWDDDQKIIQRMKICKKFYNGEECPYAERCNFLHEDPRKFRDDSGRFRESSAISIGTTGTPPPPPPPGYEIVPDQSEGSRYANNNSDLFRAGGRPSYWKTKLCSRYETTGHCPFAEKCHFAHGQAELTAGRMEGGDLGSVATIIPVKPTPAAPSNNGPESSTSAVPVVPLNQDEAAKKKSLLKLKLQNKKINRIYADWLDDSDED